jgi:hypothetical protein
MDPWISNTVNTDLHKMPNGFLTDSERLTRIRPRGAIGQLGGRRRVVSEALVRLFTTVQWFGIPRPILMDDTGRNVENGFVI